MAEMHNKTENTSPKKQVVTARRVPGRGRVAERVKGLIQPTIQSLGYTLWDVVFVKEGADYILRVTIDRDTAQGGITIDDCELVSHTLDPILDEADPIEQSYLMEVSSPGVERDLTRDEHFAACAGEKIHIRLFAPREGTRSFTGTLLGLDSEGRILLQTPADGQVLTFERADVAGVKTVFDF